MATRPEVGGTVDSHRKPIVAAKIEHRHCARRHEQEEDDRHGARQIDERQEDRLGIALADYSGGERSDDVAEPDQRERPGAEARVEPEIGEVGREMRGDEGELEAADEEPGDAAG